MVGVSEGIRLKGGLLKRCDSSFRVAIVFIPVRNFVEINFQSQRGNERTFRVFTRMRKILFFITRI